MKDFLESLEDAAECRYYEMTEGLPPGKMRCGCGTIFLEDEGYDLDPSPYGMPVCENCFEEYYKSSDPKTQKRMDEVFGINKEQKTNE